MTLLAISEEKIGKLKGIFESLDIELDVSSFNKRLRIQKLVYMFRLHEEIKPHLDFKYNLYLRGPYSPELAYVYYHLERASPIYIKLSSEAVEYCKEILSLNTRKLELLCTLVEVLKTNEHLFSDDEIVNFVHEFKPNYDVREIKDMLEYFKSLRSRYRLDLN